MLVVNYKQTKPMQCFLLNLESRQSLTAFYRQIFAVQDETNIKKNLKRIGQMLVLLPEFNNDKYFVLLR